MCASFNVLEVFLTQEVIERSHLSGEFFTAFLHQNYPEFYSSVDDLVSASGYLSDADYLTTDWVVSFAGLLPPSPTQQMGL